MEYTYGKILILPLTCSKNTSCLKYENVFLLLCAEFNADSKTVFFFLALIVFDFYCFEGQKKKKKKKNTGEANIYIYIYSYVLYIYIHTH